MPPAVAIAATEKCPYCGRLDDLIGCVQVRLARLWGVGRETRWAKADADSGERMAKKKPASAPAPPQAPVPSQIYEATLGAAGAVVGVLPAITQAQAEALRQNGLEVVVCGPNLAANRALAAAIELNANGSCKRCPPHANAGPHALPHYQPNPRPPAGHTFYETPKRKAF